jgi:hypothetical protein
MKLALALLFYAAAFVCFYAATQLAPEMVWPQTGVEYVSAHLLVIGMLSKLAGAAFLFSSIRSAR